MRDGLSGHDRQLVVSVTFARDDGGSPVNGIVEPNTLKAVHRGELIPVRYRPQEPALSALYAGPGGDVGQENYPVDYAFLAVLIFFAAMPLMTGAVRFARMIGSARASPKTELDVANVSVEHRMPRVRAYHVPGRSDLEWRVLWSQPPVAGKVPIGGFERGSWLVMQSAERQFIWPGSRVQPVIGTGMPVLPRDEVDRGVVADTRRLLKAYAHVIDQMAWLPLMVRRRPGPQAESEWWWLGAPRPVVRGLVAAHVRRRLRVLGNALTWMAVGQEGGSRTALRETGQECGELAAKVSRSAWGAVVAFMMTYVLAPLLAMYAVFFKTPPFHISWGVARVVGLLIAAIVVLLSPLVFSRSLLCKRVMFRPATAVQESLKESSDLNEPWDVYRFEREVFQQAGLREPSEWEGRRWIRWVAAEVYVLVFGLPILIGGGPALFGQLILAIAVCLALIVGLEILNAVGGVPGLIELYNQRRSRP
jgi:hypothetical protein